jgi:hypothetical protein
MAAAVLPFGLGLPLKATTCMTCSLVGIHIQHNTFAVRGVLVAKACLALMAPSLHAMTIGFTRMTRAAQ